MRDAAFLIGRILLSQIFIIAGYGKIVGYAGTAHYMAAYGVPGILLPLVILLELGGGIALLVGWQTRWAALALGIFSVLAAIIFHHQVGEGMQKILLMSDLAFAGGLFVLSAAGAGRFSLDGRAGR
jgi:putative oxidoreductase